METSRMNRDRSWEGIRASSIIPSARERALAFLWESPPT